MLLASSIQRTVQSARCRNPRFRRTGRPERHGSWESYVAQRRNPEIDVDLLEAFAIPGDASPAPSPAPAVEESSLSEQPEQQPGKPEEAEQAEQPKKRGILSHKLNETFAAEELVEELKDNAALGRRGEIILGAQLIVSLLVLFPPMKIKGLVYLTGVLGIIAGAVTALYAIFSLGRSFTPLVTPRKSGRVVKHGMFQFVRHPVYAGCIMMAFGLAAVSYSESRALLSLLLVFILDIKSRKEEAAMLSRYGDEYEVYRDSTSRFFPGLY